MRRIDSNGLITTVAGTGANGYNGDNFAPKATSLSDPAVVAVGPDGLLYIVEYSGKRIRRIAPALPGLSTAELSIASDDGSAVFVFDSLGRHLRTIDAVTQRALLTFGYDSAGRLISLADADSNVTQVVRDGAGVATALVGPFGERTTLAIGAGTSGFLTSLTTATGDTTRFTYGATGLLGTMTTPKGAVYAFTYDTLGRLVKDENPAGGFKTLARSDTVGRFTSTVATALGRTTVYRTEFLEPGVVKRTRTDPAGLASVTTEATDGAMAVTAADGMTLTSTAAADPRYGFQAPYTASLTVGTPAGLQSTITTTRAAVLATALDPFSVTTLVDSTRVNGRLFTSTYDAATRTLTEKTPLLRQSLTVVDANDRVIEERTPGLAPVSYTYDARGRLLTSTQSGRTVTATYAANGRVATVTDPLGRSSSYAYDSAGRVLTTTLPGGRQVAFTYDRNGNLLSLTPPGRSAHGFSYTPADQTGEYAPPSLSTGPTPTTFTYTLDQQLATVTRPDGVVLSLGYDAAGRPASMTTPQGNLTFGYSATTGHLTSLASPGGVSQSFTYDGALAKTASWSGPVSGSVQLTHDADFRVTGLTVNSASNIAFGYDTDGLLASAGAISLTRDAGNGLLTGTTLGSLTTSWAYDSLALTTSSTALYSATSLLQTSYARDSLGRITTLTETIQGTTSTFAYTYDTSGRLSEVRLGGVLVASYAYDLNGNRASRTTSGGTETGSVDGQDRLLAYGTASYSYTANGELLTKVVGTDTTRYSYDVRGNLLSVRLPAGTLIAYVADGQNRRIQRSVNGVVTQGFLYQGQLAPVAELDASNQVVSRFVYATRVNVPDYLIKGGVTYRVLTDYLGSVRLVVNTTTGAVVQRLDYDEFGRVTQNTSPGFQPFGYAGGLLDDQTGLVRFGARDYDPATGRWTAKDPIGFGGGDGNLYAYVENDPLNYIDPTGEKIFISWHQIIYPDGSKSQYYHAFIDVVPNDGRAPFTIGAGPGLGFPDLVPMHAGKNRKTDLTLPRAGCIELELPRGVSEDQMIGRLLQLMQNYQNHHVPYTALYGGDAYGYNSNSFASGLIEAAGMTAPPIRANLPKYSHPVAPEFFK